MLPAMSTCAMIHPPKMSPLWFASAGMGTTRSVGSLPSGSAVICHHSRSCRCRDDGGGMRDDPHASRECRRFRLPHCGGHPSSLILHPCSSVTRVHLVDFGAELLHDLGALQLQIGRASCRERV